MKALICGISGQDGSHLAKFLLRKGYSVVGTSRDVHTSNFVNLRRLGIYSDVDLVSMSLTDFRSIFNVISRYKPSEIYNLSGQTSVSLSFEQPVQAIESISISTLNLLEILRLVDGGTRLYNAGSTECFGETNGFRADETTAFNPCSPYAVAKASSYWLTANYRSSYNLYASTGILSNHESTLRPDRFVTQKIVRAAFDISRGKKNQLSLGNLDIYRDWGWSPEYVEAMWLMLQLPDPSDFVISTGVTNSLRDFVRLSFQYFGLDWENFVRVDPHLFRPTDLVYSASNPAKAQSKLDWKASTLFHDVVSKMCKSVALSLES